MKVQVCPPKPPNFVRYKLMDHETTVPIGNLSPEALGELIEEMASNLRKHWEKKRKEEGYLG